MADQPTLLSQFLFHYSTISVLPFWFIMIFFPKRQLTSKVVSSVWIIIPPILSYMLLLLPDLVENLSIFISSPNAAGFAKIMQSPQAATLFWSNAAAFDLFVGRWIFFDSKKQTINQIVISIILTITIAFGPLGFLLYFLTRLSKTGRMNQYEN